MGTTWYTPPETLLGSTRFNRASDSWSCGLVLAYLLTGGSQIFGCASDNLLDVFQRIVQVLGSPTPNFLRRVIHDAPPDTILPRIITQTGVGLRRAVPRASRDALAFMEALIVYEPDARLSAEEALDNRFLRDRPGSRSSSIPPSTRLNAIPSSVPYPAPLNYGYPVAPQPLRAPHPLPTPVPRGPVPPCVPHPPPMQVAHQQVPMVHQVRPPSIVIATPQRTPPPPNLQMFTPSPYTSYQPPAASYQMSAAVPRLTYIQPVVVPQMAMPVSMTRAYAVERTQLISFAQPQTHMMQHQQRPLLQQQVYYYPVPSARV